MLLIKKHVFNRLLSSFTLKTWNNFYTFTTKTRKLIDSFDLFIEALPMLRETTKLDTFCS